MTEQSQTLPVAAPIDTDSAGRGGEKALHSVFRVISRELNSSGTGFLHKSGKIVTAEHVVRNTAAPLIVFPDGSAIESTVIGVDAETDIAILNPKRAISGPALTISAQSEFSVGTQVSTWGFPGGYRGALPMLSVGYLSAMAAYRKPSGRIVNQ